MTTPPMTDEERDKAMRRPFGRWAGINPGAVVAGSEAQAVFCIADAQHDILALGTALSAERARANDAEAQVATLTVERDALRDALMVAVRRANDCIRGCRVLPDGGVGWGAGVCVCAKEASDAVKSFTVRAPPAGGEKL